MQDHAGVFIPPPLIYVAVFLLAVGLQRVVTLPPLPAALRILWPVPALAWLALTAPSIGRFRRARTSMLPVRPTTAVVVEGPYRFTRNPMYLGLVLLYLAVALWMRLSWAVVLLPVLIALVNVLVIRREESYLRRKFGDDYSAYQRRVRRWL